MKLLCAFLSIFISGGLLYSQITFDSGDFPKPGTSIEYYESWSDSVDMGSAGANQIFDFSKTLQNAYDTFEINFVDPSSTPYASNHPNATVAVLTDFDVDSVTQQLVFEQWDFITVTSSACNYSGITVNVDTGNMFSNAAPTSMTPFHSPYAPSMEYLGSSWTYQQTKSTNTQWTVLVGNFKHTSTITRDITIDAWGVFKNPWGSFDALRFQVEEIETGIDSVNGQLDDMYIDTNYYFEYWVKGLGHYMAKAYTDPTFTDFWGVKMANQLTPVGIERENNNVEINIYPVPASQALYVDVNVNGQINYTINDANGRIVERGIINSRLNDTHQIDLNNIEPGFYILGLSSGDEILGRRKILVE